MLSGISLRAIGHRVTLTAPKIVADNDTDDEPSSTRNMIALMQAVAIQLPMMGEEG